MRTSNVKKLLVILSFITPAFACDPVELVEYRAQLHKACLENNISEYTCNKELAALKIMEQDAQIKMNWVSELNAYSKRTTTLKLQK